MKKIRRYTDLGRTQTDWLDGRHSFSFGRYYDPEWMGFGPLRVINNDRVAGGGGFAPHPHDNMEIITYVLDGALAHRDSMGNDAVIKAGNLQMMSAGSGIRHSEFNDSADKPVHLFQIWLMPDVENEAPTYQELDLGRGVPANTLHPVVTPDGRDGTMRIKTDATLSIARLTGGTRLELPANGNRKTWIQVTRGSIAVDGDVLSEGDGIGLSQESVTVSANDNAEILVFDMAA